MALLVSLILWKNSFFAKVRRLYLIGEFNNINGLLNHAVVKYRGYPVGRVTDIRPQPDVIEVEFFVRQKYQLPLVQQLRLSLMGWLVKSTWKSFQMMHRVVYKDGDRLIGYATSGLSDFIDVGTQNLMELKAILATMSEVFGNEEISNALKEVVFSMKGTAENIEKVVVELNKISKL